MNRQLAARLDNSIPYKNDLRNIKKDFSESSFKTTKVSLASSDSEVALPIFTPISDQGSTSSCVANSTIDALEILLGIAGKPVVQLSRCFTYFNSRAYHQETHIDNGTWIRYAFDSLSRFGVCKETSWEFNYNNLFLQPPFRVFKEANDNKIHGYYKITNDRVDSCVAAINEGHPVVFASAVTHDFVKGKLGASYTQDVPKTSVFAGNHAMIICGYKEINNELYFKVRNSWGENFGNKGYCYFHKNYIDSKNLTMELWVPTLINLS